MNLISGYIFLILAISLGILSNGFLKTTESFTNFGPTIFCVISIIGCLYCLSRSMMILPVGFTYASYGGLTITEKITVLAEGDKIRRGIYRDFPTRYKDRSGKTKTVGFQLLDVKRDGKHEPFRLENISNGVRVYIGRGDHFLPHGQYSYELIYQTDRQLGFFERHDELYWNVTGNDWAFTIEQADAIVQLPAGVAAHDTELTAYTFAIAAKQGKYRRLLTRQC